MLCVGVFVSISQARVIYHQTMTPTWLEARASYIDTSLLNDLSSQVRLIQLKFPGYELLGKIWTVQFNKRELISEGEVRCRQTNPFISNPCYGEKGNVRIS